MELFYFTLPAPDLAKSKAFYSAVFGWDVGGGSMGGHVNGTATPCGLSPGSANAEETMVYITTLDLDQTIEKVEKCGGKVLKQDEYFVGRCVFCQDDQGTHFSLQEPSDETREHALNPKKGRTEGDLFFFSLPVKDEQKGRAFYSSVFRWTFGEMGEQGGLGMNNLKGPDGGLGCGRDGHRPSFWFRVGDVQKTAKLVGKCGGRAGEIFDAPEGKMSECRDDQGVKFGIVEPAPGY